MTSVCHIEAMRVYACTVIRVRPLSVPHSLPCNSAPMIIDTSTTITDFIPCFPRSSSSGSNISAYLSFGNDNAEGAVAAAEGSSHGVLQASQTRFLGCMWDYCQDIYIAIPRVSGAALLGISDEDAINSRCRARWE